VPRNRLIKAEELSRAVQLAARRGTDGVIVLVDADEDCAVELAEQIRLSIPGHLGSRTKVCIAVREVEAWFLAALPELSGRASVLPGRPPQADAETVAGAKGRIAQHRVDGRYSSAVDMVRLMAQLDIDEAKARSRSGRHLDAALASLLAG